MVLVIAPSYQRPTRGKCLLVWGRGFFVLPITRARGRICRAFLAFQRHSMGLSHRPPRGKAGHGAHKPIGTLAARSSPRINPLSKRVRERPCVPEGMRSR